MMILDHVMYELHYVTFQKFPAETMEHYGWLIYIRWVNFGPGWFLMSPLVRPGPPVPPLSLPLFRLRRLDEQKRVPRNHGENNGKHMEHSPINGI